MKRSITLLAAIIVSVSASAIEVGNGESQHNEAIDFSIQYGPWSSSPSRPGNRKIDLYLSNVKVSSCYQYQSFDSLGNMRKDISECPFIAVGDKGAVVVDYDGAMQSLYEDSGISPEKSIWQILLSYFD